MADTTDRQRPAKAAAPPPDAEPDEAPDLPRPQCDICEHFGFGSIVFGGFGISMRGPCALLSAELGVPVHKLGHQVCDRFVRRPGAVPFGPIMG